MLVRLLLALVLLSPPSLAAAEVFDAESFTLDNGLQVIVVENHRAPVVTQMVWYRVGAADEVPGKSGLAHFLEHLMFKGTESVPAGEFSDAVAENGGRENAFTSQDYTGYWQTVARDRLEMLMRYEADRMKNLALDPESVLAERDVILEERRSRIENSPSAQLNEAISAALFRNHPYGIPVIGWMHEMAALTPDDALAFYRQWYGPDNAILIIGGDVTLEEVRPLVERYYGPLTPVGVEPRDRPLEPPLITEQRITLRSVQVSEPQWSRAYLSPPTAAFAPGDIEALQLLSEILGGGSSSRLYRSLVVQQGLAVSAGAYDRADYRDYATFHLYAAPRQGVELADLEAAVEAEVARLLEEGVTEEELRQAKDRMQAAAVFARDDPSTAPHVIGAALATGHSLEEVQSWPERVEAVTVEQVDALARRLLVDEQSVTGLLLPQEPS